MSKPSELELIDSDSYRTDTYTHKLGADLTLSEEALRVANQEIERLKQDVKDEVSATRRELEQAKEEHAAKTRQLEEEQLQKIAKINEEQQARVDRMKEQFAKMSAEEVASRGEEMTQIFDSHTREMADVRAAHERELQNKAQLYRQRESDLENALKVISEPAALWQRYGNRGAVVVRHCLESMFAEHLLG